MRYTEERYISLLTDFGFKRIFGTKPNKDLLIDFLNSLFNGEQVVKDVTFLNSEHVGDVHTDRKAIFDVYCENEKGGKKYGEFGKQLMLVAFEELERRGVK